MAKKKYDFSGWATVNDMLCADGRTIKHGAFKECNGKTVPLVWNHDHNSPGSVLGHALLENRDEGVYAYCSLNDSDSANDARILVQHGDVASLSIYANHLKQIGGDVYHGDIKEVSLVLAGANPGALIEDIDLMHSDSADDLEARIYTDEGILVHSDEDAEDEYEDGEPYDDGEYEEGEEDEYEDGDDAEHSDITVGDVFDTLTDTQKEAVYAIVDQVTEDGEMQHDDSSGDAGDSGEEGNMAESEKTIGEVFDSLTDEQKEAVYAIVGQIADEQGGSEEDEDMKHNIFDYDSTDSENVLSHSDMEAIMADGANYGSLKKSALAHGFEHIDYIFPDAQTIEKTPTMIIRDMDWVAKFMNATHHTPFSKLKTIGADLTGDEARAKGYVKGAYKKEQVVKLLKRTTEPTTIYKKQKMDRDDVIDITDFDVVAWLKAEMRVMLNEEIARAALIGDGRDVGDDDKVDEEKIRPIATDEDLYTIKTVVEGGKDVNLRSKNIIKSAIKSRKNYKGSGNPTLYASNDVITDCLLVEDSIGRRLYSTEAELASAMRVKEIVEVPVLEEATVTIAGTEYDILGIIVNPVDYNFGADKGGAVSMFDDFDIDYNKQIYLIETRLSGALIKPYSAIVLIQPHTATSSDDAQG